MKKQYKVLLSLAVILLFIGLIFSFSEQNGTQSHTVSKKMSYTIMTTILYNNDALSDEKGSIDYIAGVFDGPVRKLAHVSIYLALGFIIITSMWFVNDYDLYFKHIRKAILFVFLVGMADELIQAFSGGRGSSLRDVFIDTFGGMLGIYMHFILRDFVEHLRNGIKKGKG